MAVQESSNMKILTKRDLEEILPFKKTKLNELLMSNVLPVTKVGRQYITTEEQLIKWLKDNEGKTIDY